MAACLLIDVNHGNSLAATTAQLPRCCVARTGIVACHMICADCTAIGRGFCRPCPALCEGGAQESGQSSACQQDTSHALLFSVHPCAIYRVDVEAWGSLAESASQQLTKGARVAVQGRLKQDKWTDPNGQTRTRLKVAWPALPQIVAGSIEACNLISTLHTSLQQYRACILRCA